MLVQSTVLCGIRPWAIPQEVLMSLIRNMYSEITLSKLLPHLPDANEITNFVFRIQAAKYCKLFIGKSSHTTYMYTFFRPGAHPTNDISIEFEIRPKFAVLLFKTHFIDHNEILHTSRQCNCREVSKISLWLV